MILRIDIEKESNLASKMYFKRVFHLSKFCYLRLFIILSFLFIANSSSKAQSYHKLFDHSSYFIEVPDQNAQVSYHWIFDFGDSIYNSKIYRKVYWGWNNTTLLIINSPLGF